MSNVVMPYFRTSIIAAALMFASSTTHSQIFQKPQSHGTSNTPICNSLATYFPYPVIDDDTSGINEKVVNVDLLIGKTGTVMSAEVVSGAQPYRSAVERAALNAKFRVTTNRGVPVQVRCRVLYNLDPKGPSIRVLDCFSCLEKVISIPTPKYPGYVGFGAHKYSGVVSIQILIDEHGKIESAEGISGHPFFREYLEREIQEIKFNPTVADGKPVKATVILNYKVISPD